MEFDASKWLNGGGPAPLIHNAETDTSEGVQNLIRQAIDACDVDIRQNLWSSIVVCGASTLHAGYIDRLQAELVLQVPQGFRMKIISANSMERACCAWIGGSIYASLVGLPLPPPRDMSTPSCRNTKPLVRNPLPRTVPAGCHKQSSPYNLNPYRTTTGIISTNVGWQGRVQREGQGHFQEAVPVRVGEVSG